MTSPSNSSMLAVMRTGLATPCTIDPELRNLLALCANDAISKSTVAMPDAQQVGMHQIAVAIR
jgi:hypothetical protein